MIFSCVLDRVCYAKKLQAWPAKRMTHDITLAFLDNKLVKKVYDD